MTHFGGIEEKYRKYDSSKIVILPVPYDGTSTWIKGADKGPEAILEASANMELYDIETNTEVFLQGIYTAEYILEKSSPEKMSEVVKAETLKHLNNNKLVVTIGGEHSVSIGTIQAHAEKFADLTILQIDAHSDMREEYEHSKYNHACVMARAKDLCPVVQVGIRSMDSIELPNIKNDRVFFAHQIRKDPYWANKVVEKLTKNVYLTIDLDGFDPSVLPATGTPEPGGLYWFEVIDFLQKVIQKTNLVGFDVVELCPDGSNKASDFLASKLIYKILSLKYENNI